jgi:hypothetical protein
MKNVLTRLSAGFVFAAAFVASANAEYRCDPPPSVYDRLACEAAQQGPTALRRFVERWTSRMSNLYFYDYVDEKPCRTGRPRSSLRRRNPATRHRRLPATNGVDLCGAEAMPLAVRL